MRRAQTGGAAREGRFTSRLGKATTLQLTRPFIPHLAGPLRVIRHLPCSWASGPWDSGRHDPGMIQGAPGPGQADGWNGIFDDDMTFPHPSNTPTHEDEDDLLANLRQSRFWTLTDQPGVDLLALDYAAHAALTEIYGVLFGLDDNQQEGIYSLRAINDDGMPLDTIIMFASKEDAERYACLLEVTMDPHAPHVFAISALELVDFCHECSYQCRLEPSGSLLIPPDYNVGVTDWERACKLRSGCYSVLTKDPEAAPSSSAEGGARGSAAGSQAVKLAHPAQQLMGSLYVQSSNGTLAMAKYQGMGKEELDKIRLQLEALLHDGKDF